MSEQEVQLEQPAVSVNGQQWMSKPQGQTPGVPHGLEYLTQVDQILIHQQIELFEAMTGFETKNRYAIKNSLGQQVYFAYEESDLCHRICCAQLRGFTMHIVDNNSQEVIRLVRPFKCCAGCCWCADANCCAMEIQVESPPGQVIATVKQVGSKWKPIYKILDANNDIILHIGGPCCPCQTICCTGDVNFQIKGTDKVTEVGRIVKQWGGFVKEAFTKADNFSCHFPMDMDVKIKASLIAATVLMELMLFEKNN